jgi:large subunit ribosomal protein L1
MAKIGKRLTQAQGLVEKGKLYTLEEAIAAVDSFPRAKFDESVDIAIRLGVNPRKAEENVRGTVSLPNGTGKTIRVVAFAQGEKAKEALDAGADFVGAADLVQKIQTEGWLDFEAAVATPDVMGQVGRIGKILGPRGLMPNPKVGTVTFEIGKAVAAIKSGRIEFKVEKAGIIHLGVGRVSFGKEKITENISAAIEAIVKAKPQTSKGIYLQSINISTTMGPGIAVDPTSYR